MPSSSAPVYPLGATLRCRCGRTGTVSYISSHRAGAKRGICKQPPEVIAVGDPDGRLQPVEPERDGPEAIDGEGGPDGETGEEGSDEGDGPSPPDPGPEPSAPPLRAGREPASKPAPQRRQSSIDRGDNTHELEVPSPTALARGEPLLIKAWVHLPVKLLAVYEALRFHPDPERRLDPGTTPSQFVAEVCDAWMVAIDADLILAEGISGTGALRRAS